MMYSDPSEKDSDGDGLEDNVDSAPNTLLTKEEEQIICFFNSAEYFEIEFALDYYINNKDKWLEEDPNIAMYKAVQCTELCREYSDCANIDEIITAFEDAGIAYNRYHDKNFGEKVLAFFAGKSGELSLFYVSEYNNRKLGTSFYEMMEKSYYEWTNYTQIALTICVFGWADCLCSYDTNGNIKFDKRWYKSDGSYIWPENNGFSSTPQPQTLNKGDIISRYGSEGGRYASPIGTSFNERSLAPGSEFGKYYEYEVLKPINVLSGTATPFFGSEGGGVQYMLENSVYWYIKNGYLRRI